MKKIVNKRTILLTYKMTIFILSVLLLLKLSISVSFFTGLILVKTYNNSKSTHTKMENYVILQDRESY